MTRILIAQLLLWPMLVPGTPAAGQIPTGERDDSASTRAGRFTDEALMLESPLARDIFNYVATGRRDPFLPVAVRRRWRVRPPWKRRCWGSSATPIPA